MASESGRYGCRWRQMRTSADRPNQCSHTRVAMRAGVSAACQMTPNRNKRNGLIFSLKVQIKFVICDFQNHEPKRCI